MVKGRQRDITLADLRMSQSKNYIQATILSCDRTNSRPLCVQLIPYMQTSIMPGVPVSKYYGSLDRHGGLVEAWRSPLCCPVVRHCHFLREPFTNKAPRAHRCSSETLHRYEKYTRITSACVMQPSLFVIVFDTGQTVTQSKRRRRPRPTCLDSAL